MSWTTLATINADQDWQNTPAIPSNLGYVRMSFFTAGIPIQVAQVDLISGDMTDQRRIVATPYAQILDFKSPEVFGENRAIAVRLPLPGTEFDVTIEVSDIPFDSSEPGGDTVSEKGSWVPVLKVGSNEFSSDASPFYYSYGEYTKIGNLITFSFGLGASGLSSFGSGELGIKGFPGIWIHEESPDFLVGPVCIIGTTTAFVTSGTLINLGESHVIDIAGDGSLQLSAFPADYFSIFGTITAHVTQ